MRFEVKDDQKQSLLDALKNLFSVKYVELIMRSVVKRLPAHGSLAYQRPESLEEVPTKDIDTLVRESKGLLAQGGHPREEHQEHNHTQEEQ
jgi:hypothetical protein